MLLDEISIPKNYFYLGFYINNVREHLTVNFTDNNNKKNLVWSLISESVLELLPTQLANQY